MKIKKILQTFKNIQKCPPSVLSGSYGMDFREQIAGHGIHYADI